MSLFKRKRETETRTSELEDLLLPSLQEDVAAKRLWDAKRLWEAKRHEAMEAEAHAKFMEHLKPLPKQPPPATAEDIKRWMQVMSASPGPTLVVQPSSSPNLSGGGSHTHSFTPASFIAAASVPIGAGDVAVAWDPMQAWIDKMEEKFNELLETHFGAIQEQIDELWEVLKEEDPDV